MFHRVVQRRGHVEVAGGAPHDLQHEDDHLPEQGHRRRPGDEADPPAVAAHEAEQPDQGERVDGDGAGELGRLEPGGLAGDDARIQDEARRGRGQVSPMATPSTVSGRFRAQLRCRASGGRPPGSRASGRSRAVALVPMAGAPFPWVPGGGGGAVAAVARARAPGVGRGLTRADLQDGPGRGLPTARWCATSVWAGAVAPGRLICARGARSVAKLCPRARGRSGAFARPS